MDIVKVEFNSDIVEIVDNFISVKKLCENMGLKYETQTKKIKADDSFESQLIEIKTAGGMQEALCIPYNKLNGWLFSISVNRVKPEVKAKLIEYKKECFEVLYNHFNQPQATPTQLDLITPYEVRRDLTTARRLLTLEKKKHRATAEHFEAEIIKIKNENSDSKLKSENALLKRTLVEFHNRYHNIVLKSQEVEKTVKTELLKLTNCFQQLPAIKYKDKNLNTNTVAGHSYW